MRQTIGQYAKENCFNTLNAIGSGLDSFKNFSGPGSDWIVVKGIGRNRDTEDYDPSASNFDSALDLLGGESKTVKVERFGHWGCGWFELIMIDPKDKGSLKIAQKITADLEAYPILDDSDFCEREQAYRFEYANGAKGDLAKALVHHFALPTDLANDKAMLYFAVELNMTCQEYYGSDSCVDLYVCREPSDSDLDRLFQCIKAMRANGVCQDNVVFKFFNAAFGLESEV